MSKPEATPTQQPLTPEQQYQQMFSTLSKQFKNPIRTMMSETEEAVQNIISSLIQQIIQLNNALQNTTQENTLLKKLCTDNKISFTPKPPNRAQRRESERKQAKK